MRLITVKVKPGSKTSSVTEDEKGMVIVQIKSRPIKGAANNELIKLLAYYFKIPTSSINIKSGHTSRLKTIIID